MEIRNPLLFAGILFAGHDDGQWTLPVELLTARDRLNRVVALHEQEHTRTPEHPHDLTDRLGGQVAAGADIDLEPIEAARRDQVDHDDRMRVLNRAREMASNALVTALNATARQTIADHLRPAYDKLVAAMSKDFATVAHIPADAPLSVILTEPKPVRDAAIRIDAAVARYDTLRSAYSLLRKIGDQAETPDGLGWFFETKNTEILWPAITGLMAVNPSDAPWSRGSTRDRLAWFFANGAELWMPTAEEQAQRWLESPIGEKTKEHQANRANLEGYRQMFDTLPQAQPAEPGSPAAAYGARLFGETATTGANE